MTIPIEIKDLHFRYPKSGKYILNGIRLEVKRGRILAITGLSGSGKTTLCYCICGIIPHIYGGEVRGEVLLFGKPVKGMDLPVIATKVGIVFQEPDTQLFSPTVEDEVAFGPENLCLDRKEIGKRIKSCLELVGMKKKRYEHPEHLSGGEKQLVAIASVLALDPEILILDEAMSEIDYRGRTRIKETILRLRDWGKGIVVVEHDRENLDIADSTVELKGGGIFELEAKELG
ncbi:MAG: ABC transporter ATP-binding protein [Candidatus Humimicrobiaceae bacterium]